MNKPSNKPGPFHFEPRPHPGLKWMSSYPGGVSNDVEGEQNRVEHSVRDAWRLAYKIFAAYLLVLWIATGVFMLQPPTYEVSALLALHQSLYGEESGKHSNLLRADEIARSQVSLLESEDVIREANRRAGKKSQETGAIHEFAQQTDKLLASLSERIRIVPQHGEKNSPEDAIYLMTKRNLKVRSEPYTNLLKINYRDTDPEYAVAFTRALVQVFADRHFDLYTSVRASDFFAKRREESRKEYVRASAALVKFAAENKMFATDDEKRLLLEQRSKLNSGLAATRGAIAEKESAAAAIPEQLKQMKQMERVARHNGLIDDPSLRAGSEKPPGDRATEPIPNLGSDPPLLLVRVYQETVASLVKLRTELIGLRALAEQQNGEIAKITAELGRIAAKRAEYEMLQFEMQRAKANSEQFAKRAYDEQLAQDLNAERLSNVQVVQKATRPLSPIWPRSVIALIALLLSFAPLIAVPAVRRMASTR